MISASVALTVVAVMTAALFAGAGLAKLLSATISVEMRDALAVSPRLWKIIGTLEVAGSVAVALALVHVVPAWLGAAAAVGFILLIVGAIITRIRAASPFGLILGDVVTLAMAAFTLVAMNAR